MTNNLGVKTGTDATVKTTDNTGVHTPHHNVDVIASGSNVIGKVGVQVGGNDIADAHPVPVVEGNSAAPITGASMPAGGVGLTGWLSAIWSRLGSAATAAKQPALGAAGTASTDVITVQGIASGVTIPVVAGAGENFVGSVGGKSFDVVVVPTVTNGAYSAGDIVGGLIEVAAGRVANGTVTLQSVEIHLKAAVTSNLTVVLFSANPSSTTTTDNAAYSLNAADVFKVRSVITGFTLTNHGTPNTYGVHSLNRILTTDASSKFYALILDGTGFTLTSTSDLQIRFAGYQD